MDAAEFARRLIDTATTFVGLRETESNAAFNDAKRSKQLIAAFKRVPWWASGAPYCASFDGAVVIITAEALGLNPAGFLKHWTAHCMTNVRKMRELGYLSTKPTDGALFLARHGSTDSGHAGLVASIASASMSTIEGNTSSGESGSQRNGDGIFARTRNITQNGDLSTQGFVPAAAILKMMGVAAEFTETPKAVFPKATDTVPILHYLEKLGKSKLLPLVLKMPGAVYDKGAGLTMATPAAIEKYIGTLG